jgi:hypothetical protein
VGATLISDGLAEAHVADGALELTLLRAVGELSKATLRTRPGHAGWPASTPAAQCPGAFRARCALSLHGAMNDGTLATIRDACDALLVPLVGETWLDLDGASPDTTVSGVELDGDAFEMLAVTVSSVDDTAVLLRAVNLTSREAAGAWQLPDAGPWIAEPVRLDEQSIGNAHRCESQLEFTAGANEVVTWRVRRAF